MSEEDNGLLFNPICMEFTKTSAMDPTPGCVQLTEIREELHASYHKSVEEGAQVMTFLFNPICMDEF